MSGSKQSSYLEGVEQREMIDRRIGGKPDVAMIGNSMLGTRIDKNLIREISGDERVIVLTEGNTFTPIWFLTLKQLCEAPTPPKVVVIFFRDRFLTWPGFRFDEISESFALGLMGDHRSPAVLEYFADGGDDSWGGELVRLRKLMAEPDVAMNDRVSDMAMDLTKLENGKDERSEAMNERFSLGNLRHDVPDDLGEELESLDQVTMNGYTSPTEFAVALEDSLLPEMVKLTKEKNIQLIFFRVKRRPDADTGMLPDTEALDQYLADMRTWLEARDVVFMDGNDSAEFTLKDYADGDHISKKARPAFTRWFWKELQPYLDR